MNISEHKCCRCDDQQDRLSLDGMKACGVIFASAYLHISCKAGS